MAATQQERDQGTATKRKALGEVELRHTVRPGIEEMLTELQAWHGIKERSEAVQNLILNARPDELDEVAEFEFAAGKSGRVRHYIRPGPRQRLADLSGDTPEKHTVERLIIAAHRHGPNGSAPYLKTMRHEIIVSEAVAQKIRRAGIREAHILTLEEESD